ncbi:hypothetical protein BABINDRAFT_162613 [Babjeviella inositovora NRRL Y-12698]|uniref:cAMP-dependent protein kinase regulatory subunit n=1 Tax=Babjeviella inositovora NRRL Y-12698 TaxID=984486 RepID=A0A1E3QLN1_9ASCO|nr:uncharacterized protein BABINDRAFT_162613 [Babjeviella inositovora NRRL Y-12698]ODQ78374.1 hypothetical protein BABINDRAFT_162613 [Babjeviella inositovora NRRL Y-12698]
MSQSNYNYVDELAQLNKDILAKNPADILQFCSNYFLARLEDQRKQLWNQQQRASAAGITLFPRHSVPRQSNSHAFPAFKTPFGDNDPHSEDPHHDKHTEDEGPGAPAASVPTPGLFRGTFGAPASSLARSVDPSDKSESDTIAPLGAKISKLPAHFNANRRTSVSAETLNPNKFLGDWKPPVRNLTSEQLSRLNSSVAKNFLFGQLDDEELNTVIHALEEKRLPQNTEIIKQGDEGDFFYVIEKGEVDFYVNGDKVNTSGPGSSFGELALMYNSFRAATAVATTDCVLWALDRLTFRRILLEGTAKKRAMYEVFFKDVPVLASLSAYEKSKLADALVSKTFQPGTPVVVEGDVGENFYFIESGTAEVSKEGEGVVSHLAKGDYFGELALLNDSPRKATVTASSVLKVATLGKSGFQRLLGPVVEVLKRQDPTHQ